MNTTNDVIDMTNYTEKEKSISEALIKLGFSTESRFIPFSRSRNAKETHKSLNWKITLLYNGKPLIPEFDYSQGCAHCPAYKKAKHPYRLNIAEYRAVALECEEGVYARLALSGESYKTNTKLHPPSLAEIIYCTVSDANLGQETFEDFCSNLGYDTDSRKAEQAHNQCKDTFIAMSRIPDSVRTEAENLLQDY